MTDAETFSDPAFSDPASRAEDDAGPVLTVAQAAQRLGVPERRLRHVLARPEYAARCRQVTRRTRSGTRQGAGVPPDLLADLASETNAARDAALSGNETAQGGDNAATVHGGDAVLSGTLLAPVYQQRIADLEAMNAELRADKARLYGLLETAQGNLAREQALRSLPAPVSGEGEPPAVKARTQGFWGRLWGRRGQEGE